MPLPIIGIVTAVLPALIRIAEVALPRREGEPERGSLKKAMVLRAVEGMYDGLQVGKILPDFERVDEKRLILDLAGVLIDHLVPDLT